MNGMSRKLANQKIRTTYVVPPASSSYSDSKPSISGSSVNSSKARSKRDIYLKRQHEHDDSSDSKVDIPLAELSKKKTRQKRARLGTALSDVTRESDRTSQGLESGDEFSYPKPMAVDEIDFNNSQFADSGDKSAGASEVNYQTRGRPPARKQLLYSSSQLI